MRVTFDGDALFSSGPCRLHVGGLALRHVLLDSPGGRGVRVSPQGTRGRAITQTGVLLADTADEMRELARRIEAKLDGHAHDLVDEAGALWANTVMLSFDPGEMTGLGPRRRMDYTITYVQVLP